ncbi:MULTISPECIES: hypothetical protein [unclassified Actinotalea]|uniref:hypothetical protein n=1 Tax=unclassified Actinotalea TaxID=2638618 RepID=UPI0015F5FCA2|nr:MULTISPECIES: hypothetical protein [unclassified Actinotalea]
MGPTYFFIVVLALVVTGTLARYGTRRGRAAAADAYARKVDLTLDPAMAADVGARLARRACLGAVVGAGLALLPLLLMRPEPAEEGSFPAALLAVLGYFLGAALGSAAVAWYESTRPLAAGPRIARATTPTPADYVPPFERYGAWACAVVAALVAVGIVVVDAVGLVDVGRLPVGLLVAVTVVPALVVLAVELAARWLVARRQVAATTLELAWDDAMRARTLRDSATVAIMAGAYAPFALLGVLADGLEGGWPANPAVGLVSGIMLVLFGGLLVMGVWSLAARPERYFRTRLWPLPPAGDVPAQASSAPEGGAR